MQKTNLAPDDQNPVRKYEQQKKNQTQVPPGRPTNSQDAPKKDPPAEPRQNPSNTPVQDPPIDR